MSSKDSSILRLTRGQIVYIDTKGFDIRGREQAGDRYAVVVQNDRGNIYSSTTIVAMITSKKGRSRGRLPVHVDIPKGVGGIPADSIILCEQLRTIDKSRVSRVYKILPSYYLELLDIAIRRSVGKA